MINLLDNLLMAITKATFELRIIKLLENNMNIYIWDENIFEVMKMLYINATFLANQLRNLFGDIGHTFFYKTPKHTPNKDNIYIYISVYTERG